MNEMRDFDTYEFCPLLEREIDITECYDVQMVAGRFIKETILDFTLDRDRAAELCPLCPYNQLYDTAAVAQTAAP